MDSGQLETNSCSVKFFTTYDKILRASEMYRGFAYEGVNWTVLMSGESGTRKTETVKISMTDFVMTEQTRPVGGE